jgi:hypothetical protein
VSRFDDDPRLQEAAGLRRQAVEPGAQDDLARCRRLRRRAHSLEHAALADLLAPKIGRPADLPADAQVSLF